MNSLVLAQSLSVLVSIGFIYFWIKRLEKNVSWNCIFSAVSGGPSTVCQFPVLFCAQQRQKKKCVSSFFELHYSSACVASEAFLPVFPPPPVNFKQWIRNKVWQKVKTALQSVWLSPLPAPRGTSWKDYHFFFFCRMLSRKLLRCHSDRVEGESQPFFLLITFLTITSTAEICRLLSLRKEVERWWIQERLWERTGRMDK